MATSSEVTRLLQRMGSGEREAGDALIPLIYKELRTLAAGVLKSERTGHTLQPTALVHEAYLKLVDQRQADYSARGHFMAVAAMVMRHILVNTDSSRLQRLLRGDLDWIVMKCLEKDRERRYATTAELADASCAARARYGRPAQRRLSGPQIHAAESRVGRGHGGRIGRGSRRHDLDRCVRAS